MGINPMNKITIIIRILFAVTLFQQIKTLNQVENTVKAPPRETLAPFRVDGHLGAKR
jgi:hypothetical protein